MDQEHEHQGSLVTGLILFTGLGALSGLGAHFILEALRPADMPAGEGKMLFALLIAITTAPTAYWLTSSTYTRIASAVYALVLGGGLAGLYLLAETTFGWGITDSPGLTLLSACGFLIGIISLPFFRTVFERRESVWHYPSLFEFAWNTPVMVAVASLFTGIFWIVLWLWGALFDIIDIGFFSSLFRQDLFQRMVTPAAFATAIAVLRGRERVILTVRGVLFALLHVLAPILTVATALFVIALPFTDLDPLREIGSPVALLVWVTIGAITLMNAVLGDGERHGATERFAGVLNMIMRLQGLLLPIFVGLAGYVLWQRIVEEPVTVTRVYAVIVLGILALYALVYAVAGLLPRWAAIIRPANIVLAGVTVAVAIVLMTPLVNPYRISAEDHLARLESGEISPVELNYGYLRYRLGAAGETALERLRTDDSLPDHETILAQLDVLDETGAYYEWRQRGIGPKGSAMGYVEALETRVERVPAGLTVPQALIDKMLDQEAYQRPRLLECNPDKERDCMVVTADLQGDAAPEYWFIVRNGVLLSSYVYYEGADGLWHSMAIGSEFFGTDDEALAVLQGLRDGDLETAPVHYEIPVIGGRSIWFEMRREEWFDKSQSRPGAADRDNGPVSGPDGPDAP